MITVKAEAALMWIESLCLPDTLKYPQSIGRLEVTPAANKANPVNKIGFCCLGLECKVNERPYRPTAGGHPAPSKVGLLHKGGESSENSNRKSLISMNDVDGRSFLQIGEQLKKHPHSYFESEVAAVIKLAYS